MPCAQHSRARGPAPNGRHAPLFAGPPASLPGAEQTASWQVSPFGQCVSVLQDVAQPVAVQTWPVAQLLLPLQEGWSGADTSEQP